MRRTCSFQSFPLLFAIFSTVASMYPIFNPVLVSPLPSSILLPPVSQPRNTVSNSPVLLPTVRRRQPLPEEDNLPPEKEPTCAELKTMWRKMRRISRQMELTNEVPKLQDPFVAGAYSYRPSKYPDENPYSLAAKSSRIKVFQSPFEDVFQPKPAKSFGKIIRDPGDHGYYYSTVKNKMSGSKSPRPSARLGFDEFDDDFSRTNSRERVPGRFANNPLPEEALGVYGTVVHTPEERARFKALTRRPPVEGYRSRLIGFDRGANTRIPFRATKPHGTYHYGSVVTHLPSDRVTNPRYPTRTSQGGYAEYPPEVGQRSPISPTRVERLDKVAAAKAFKNSCLRSQNKTCKTDVDCFCIGGPKLFCGGNRCRPQFKALKYSRAPKWGQGLFVDPYEATNLLDYELKKDPLWPAPF